MRYILTSIAALVILIASLASSQPAQPTISMGTGVLRIGMEKQDVLKSLSACCRTVTLGAMPSLGDSSLMVTNKEDVNDVYGNVYFRNGRVAGVLANRDWSQEPDAYKSALSLFRLVDSTSHGQPVRATITSKTREMTNGSSKSVLITLDNGRSFIVEISNIDPGQKMNMEQVVTSECLGPC